MIHERSILSMLNFKIFAVRTGQKFIFKKIRGRISVLNNLIMITLLIISMSASCSKNLTMKYSVIDENIVDTAVKTQITLKLKVSGEITTINCREVLNRLYNEYKKKEGFKYSKTPGSLFIFLYDSTESAEDPDQWLGMLSWSSSSIKPQISIKEEIISELEMGSAQKFGLSLKKRKQIFVDAVVTRDRTTAEAGKKYPVPRLSVFQDDSSYSQILTSKKVQTQLEKQNDYIRLTTPIYIKEVIKKHNINQRILTEIVIEGYKKKWPLPEARDDGFYSGD